MSKKRAKSHISADVNDRVIKNTGYGAKRLLYILVIILLAGLRSLAATDVLFLIDTTGSMDGLSTFKTVLTDILTAIDANSLCPETLNYGVADYRNYVDGGNYTAYGVNLVLPFTSSVQDALTAINGLAAGGGGDGPESQLKAMVSIADNWLTTSGDLGFNGRPGAQRILIWAGDQPGHIAGDEPGSDGPPPAGYYPSLDDTIDALTSQWITVFALNSAGCNAGLNKAHGSPARQQASEITAATGGKLYCNVGSVGQDIEIDIIDELACFAFSKDDGIEPNDCVAPDQEITYTICWTNDSSRTVYDAFIIDWLPEGVSYPQGAWGVAFGDPNDPESPPFTFIPPDPGYDEQSHSYVWPIGNIGPSTNGCVQLNVVVNEKAIHGGILHNVAELYGTVYDPNNQNPVERLIARIFKDTNVCCYAGIIEELYVDQSATHDGNTGLNWKNAFLELRDALDYARSSICGTVHSIYVAQGTYSPGDHEWDTFDIPDGVAVYGGFPKGGGDLWQRDPQKYKTTLTGRIDETRWNTTVVTMGHETLIDGFTVTESNPIGYGIFGSAVDFSLSNCRIENNEGYGLYAEDGNVSVSWCTIRNNKADGIRHIGEGFTLILENVWVRQSGRHGIITELSTPLVLNSILSESDMTKEGREGIRMISPSSQPVLRNLTVAHNKAAGIALFGSTLPEIQNSIVFHNGGDALSGFSADEAAWYSCIEDANSVNYNINVDPQFAYFDPNNVRLSPASLCLNASNPYLDYSSQLDMDGNPRVYGAAPDMGAYELICDTNVSNEWDLNADGVINLYEFNFFSRAWLSHDPNDPAWLADPELADPNLSEGWYEWKHKFNLDATGNSTYSVDLADLLMFLEDAPWLWVACWRTDLQPEMMMSGFDSGSMRLAGFESQSLEKQTTQEITSQEQLFDLVSMIVQLENLWLTEAEIRQEIDAADWQRFMEEVYQTLYNLATEVSDKK